MCLPLLFFITRTRQKYCEPVEEVLLKIRKLEFMRSQMLQLDCIDFIQKFLAQDNTESKEKQPIMAQNLNKDKIKSKRDLIYEELNQMVAFVKRLEF
jgi:hypothetical protein